mmetsp:Transcript_33883/g.79972  ORF Transcript_33883/g.79972 Transcript_33883/m.79972 type:complete len:480 (+) Transcript_33883:57-1496(+)
MSRRLPSSLAHQLKCCKLFTTGQRCATCPSKGSNPCPLPDIEDCLLPRQLAAQASRVQSQLRIECEVPRDDVQKPIGLSAVVKSEREARSKEVKLLRPKPLSPAAGCMRLLASVPSASPPSRGMKIVSPQEAPSMSVGLGVPADQPLVSADPFEVFRALRKAAEQRSATSVTLSSSEGKALFQEAMAVGSMENYFDLAQNHITQGTEGADNSLSCMAMILNALGHDPKHTWKGMWRWNTPEVLQREDPNAESTKVDVVDFAAKARCKGANANAFPCSSLEEIAGLEQFRSELKAACENAASSSHVVVHFDRAAIGLAGHGHFSPVGGYHAEKDMVLILDVARKASPPYWVAARDLFKAMSGKGYVTVVGCGAVAEEGEAAADAEARMCPVLIASWAQCPLSSGDLAWHLNTRTSRRRVWQRHPLEVRGRRAEKGGLMHGEASGLLHGVLSKSLDLMVLASSVAGRRRNSMRMAAEYGRD